MRNLDNERERANYEFSGYVVVATTIILSIMFVIMLIHKFLS